MNYCSTGETIAGIPRYASTGTAGDNISPSMNAEDKVNLPGTLACTCRCGVLDFHLWDFDEHTDLALG